jgi:Arc/MetJ-type ribon-helix-helix transcriptional regulator
MTINLPKELESSVRAEVLSGHFASEDDMIAAALQEYFRQHGTPQAAQAEEGHDPLLGLMSDHAELMDEIVEDAMRHREQQPWRMARE